MKISTRDFVLKVIETLVKVASLIVPYKRLSIAWCVVELQAKGRIPASRYFCLK